MGLNVSLPENKEYIEVMRSALNYTIKDAENLKNPSLSCDFIKCIIRTESFFCSITKVFLKKNLLTLNKRLEILEETICQMPMADLIEVRALIKREIEKTYHQKAIGSIIRTRCKLIEEFETPTNTF